MTSKSAIGENRRQTSSDHAHTYARGHLVYYKMDQAFDQQTNVL